MMCRSLLVVFLLLLTCVAGAQEVTNPITNPGFETGDLTGWTVESSTNAAMFGLGAQDGNEGAYAVRSDGGFTGIGEDNTGVLVSDAFTVPAIPDGATGLLLKMLMAGHRGQDIATGAAEDIPANRKNYVVVCSAADDLELTDHVWPPRSDTMGESTLDVTTLAGTEVYIKIVDDAADGGYAWLAVDNFTFDVPIAPGGINGNGNFETGDLTGWTVSDPGTGAWVNQPAQIGRTGREGYYAVSSFPAGESKTGTLRSDTFNIPGNTTELRFLIAGHFEYGGDPNNMGGGTVNSPWNYVALYQSNGTEVERIYAPANDGFQPRSFDVSGLVGQDAYVEIVDNSDATGYAWIAADNFRLITQTGPACEEWTCNSGFELGTYAGWVTDGAAWESTPTYQVVSSVPVYEGDYFAASRANENETGTLRTTPFEVTADMYAIRYKACGWSSPSGDPANGLQYNYAMLKDASDDSDLLSEKVFVTNSNITWLDFEIDLSPFVGTTVYLQFVDDSTGGYSWMAVDNVTLYDEAAWRLEDDDEDGLTNGEESDLGTEPLNPDTDGDGLDDGAEVNTYTTNPLLEDTDGDGFTDGEEVNFGTDPLDPEDYPINVPVGGTAVMLVLAAFLAASGARRGLRAARR